MKKIVAAITCNAIASVCWGILLYAGIYDGKTVGAILYGLCLVCSVISLILNIILLKKEKHDDSDKN
ncbi:MAG: hypothetical protein J6C96_03215 [Oscillospiraceae bacterium]|nr:hypothetical protein [Oscillospiraceae bacterium]